MDEIRRRGEQPRPSEIAEIASDSGLSVQEALQQVQRFSNFRHFQTNESFDAVAQFITDACAKFSEKSVLEYTLDTNLLSARLLEHSELDSVQLLTPNTEIAEAFRTLFGKDAVSDVRSLSELDPSKPFDCVICQQPLGHRSKGNDADGFGDEIVKSLPAFVSEKGLLFWMTSRGVRYTAAAQKTLSALEVSGLHVLATIDIPAGAFLGSSIEGALIIFGHPSSAMKFVGVLRDKEVAEPMAAALLEGPTKKPGPSWAWLKIDDPRSYSDLEQSELLDKLKPYGCYELTELGKLLTEEKIVKADKPISQDSEAPAFLFVPEYAGSQVTDDLEEQTVKPKAVYRLAIDTQKANPRFLALLLNSPYGRQVRESAAQGTTIPRTSVAALKELALPLPDLPTQEWIARIESDLSLLISGFGDIQDALDRDWTGLSDVAEKVDALKAVLDIEQHIENWWRELPYPLATIYRRYQVSTEPKERFDKLLHFFEMAAVYLAAIGTSHVKALRSDWQVHFARWFHPSGVTGIERADFGFWTMLAGASLKDLSRVASDPELRATATDIAGAELVQIASGIGLLGKTTQILDFVRRYRNSWKGHGGHLKSSDAARLDGELQQSIRDFYEATARTFRQFQLVRPGLAEVTDTGMAYQIELLTGSDPVFEIETAELSRPAKSKALAFWMKGARSTCRALPFFRFGAPQEPQESSFYVFSRVENGGFRWISYQEAREQQFVAPDDELLNLIELPRGD